MASSDIYSIKEPPGQNRPSRRHRRTKSFDETTQNDVAASHRRRSGNSGFRRFRHLMKKPDFSKKFWTVVMGTLGLILVLLIVWDFFFRYSAPAPDDSQDIYEAVAE
jgi:hypothetical protein